MGNPVVHFEIAGPDGPALRQFYSDLFGWKIDVQSEEMGNYGLVSANEGGIGGGVFPTTEDIPARSYVTFYVQVDDLRAALDKVVGMGGRVIMPPMEIALGMGSIALFGDPADNTIGLHSPPPEWDGQMPPKGDGPPVAHFEVGSAGRAGIVTSSLPLTGVLLHLRFYASRRFRTTKKPAYTRACGRVEAITDMAMASTLFLRSGQRPTQPARPPFPAPC